MSTKKAVRFDVRLLRRFSPPFHYTFDLFIIEDDGSKTELAIMFGAFGTREVAISSMTKFMAEVRSSGVDSLRSFDNFLMTRFNDRKSCFWASINKRLSARYQPIRKDTATHFYEMTHVNPSFI